MKTPPLRKFWPDFLSGVLLFPKFFRRFAAGFCCFQKFSPPAAGIYCCPKIRMFVAKFHRFCLEKAKKNPAASRRGLVFQKLPAASRRGFVVSKKNSAASRRGFVVSRFLRKIGSGDLQWGRFKCYLPGNTILNHNCFVYLQFLTSFRKY